MVYGVCLCIACAIVVYMQFRQKPACYVVDRPQMEQNDTFGGDFTLLQAHRHDVDSPQQDRKTTSFSLKDVRGKFVILYFGYTYCPDVCPLGLSNISRAIVSLDRDRDQFVPIFVTVDPERDTADLLSLYATNFNSAFVMLTGNPTEIDMVKHQYRVYAKKAETDSKGKPTTRDNYLIDHSTYVYILDRNGKFIKQIPHDMSSEEMKKVFVELLLEKKRI
jgi:cytochrome oxidase Cu insertion factor (SCO1/SenC/PrrC family)